MDETALERAGARPERTGAAHQRPDETVDSPLVEGPRGTGHGKPQTAGAKHARVDTLVERIGGPRYG